MWFWHSQFYELKFYILVKALDFMKADLALKKKKKQLMEFTYDDILKFWQNLSAAWKLKAELNLRFIVKWALLQQEL